MINSYKNVNFENYQKQKCLSLDVFMLEIKCLNLIIVVY